MHRQAQAVHDVAAGLRLPRGAHLRIRADHPRGHLVESRTRRRPRHVHDLLRRPPQQGTHQQGGEHLGGGLGLDREVRLARAQTRGGNDLARGTRAETRDHHGRQAHDRAVTGAVRALGGHRHTLFVLVIEQRGTHLATDIETPVRRRAIPLRKPPLVAVHHVKRVVAALRQQRIRDAQSHRRVIRPLPGLQQERAATHHVRNRLESSRPLELIRGAHRVADRQAHQGAARPRKKSRHVPSVPQAAPAGIHACTPHLPEARGRGRQPRPRLPRPPRPRPARDVRKPRCRTAGPAGR